MFDLETNITDKNIDDLISRFNRHFIIAVVAGLRSAAGPITRAVIAKIIENESVFRKNLINDIKTETKKEFLKGEITLEIASLAPYSMAVEFGTGPQVNIDVERIREWLIVKNGSDKFLKQVIQTLENKGAEPHPFFFETIENMFPDVIATISKEMRAIL